MTNPLLRVSALTTLLGSEDRPVRVVDSVDLELRRGETFALLGESGCGKSMMALSLMRLLPPSGRITQGSVWLGNTELLALPEHAMRGVRGGRMGMIFQEPQTSLNPVLTVGRQIAEAVHVHGDSLPPGGGGAGRGGSVAERLSRRRTSERVLELLSAVGIPDPERRSGEYPHQLSGGMKQRVMIAMALAGAPELLIADEPTTALDVTIQAQVLRLLKGLQRETGMAVLLITHDLGVVAETADRLAVMYAGHILETATVADFFARPAHPYSNQLMASLPAPEKRTGSLAVIPGRVPPLDRPFQGCRFADRCHRVMDRCRDQAPAWHTPSVGHQVRCHLWEDGEPTADAGSKASGAKGAVPRGEMGKTVLRVADLKVHFPIHKGVFRRVVGHVKAVDGVSMDLCAGGTLALVGESGCGKTTVGKGILRLIPTTGGTVRFNGTELTRLGGRAMRGYRKDLQIIFQDPFAAMNPRMLVGDIVGEGLQALRLEPNRAKRLERVYSLLDRVGMSAETADRYPHEFSGGQRQRICIARALAVEPKVIVCDEPTSALDVSVQAQILNLLRQLQRDLDLSYLFITHNLAVVSYLAHAVAVMYLGRIVERGTVAEVLDDPRHPYTKALLSAVPVIDPDQRREVIRLEGDMPSPSNPPAGCHFHPRCPEAGPECTQTYPVGTKLSDTRTVHCVRVGN
ncbi:ABC transporter ATP-binding protein [Candidatus Thiosymbion oneisti]|uniref:ABC transporter ATP-binding protein n=1 Tax=Candidatus Thiosymbion oneisti TaxID=589554 RepID=UPI0010620E12|nr:ABC transporter ATP-binding protein [Candidatus Thiosymbion oneisti]